MTAAAWTAWRSHAEWMPAADAAWRNDQAVAAALALDPVIAGICSLCARSATFRFEPHAESTRDSLHCSVCGAHNRQRAVALLLLAALPDACRARVYITEQASSFYAWLRLRVGQLIGSEYGFGLRRRLQMSSWLWRRRILERVRMQDVTALSFDAAGMDAVVCQDVLEHVPDYRAALREFARVLKPGGVLLVTVPFYDRSHDSVQIASLDGAGRPVFAGAPEYHGDPVNGGVPCFHHFGWDLLDAMRTAGFAEADACRVQDVAQAFPQGHWVLRARH